MDRRTTIKWVLAASAAWALLRERAAGADPSPAARGYGTDPNLIRAYKPGELWPLTLTPPQRRLAGVLSDIIMPADERSPSASSVGVVDFIDEVDQDRKSTRLNSSHSGESRMPSSA